MSILFRDGLLGRQEYPSGAIRTYHELNDLLAEAGKTRRAIRLHIVEQGGHQSEFIVTRKSRVAAGKHAPDIFFINGWASSRWSRSPAAKDRWYKTERALGDLNILARNGRSGGHNRHMLFRNRRAANEYADSLRHDAAYQASIKQFHARCDKMFGGMWS